MFAMFSNEENFASRGNAAILQIYIKQVKVAGRNAWHVMECNGMEALSVRAAFLLAAPIKEIQASDTQLLKLAK